MKVLLFNERGSLIEKANVLKITFNGDHSRMVIDSGGSMVSVKVEDIVEIRQAEEV